MRVVSMVPSWTETLITWGVDVVGRTRYCIHPEKSVVSIPVIGGTKDTRWERLERLQADLIVVDKEENKKTVLDKTKVPLFISHVESVEDMIPCYQKFYETFKSLGASKEILVNIKNDIKRWEKVLVSKKVERPFPGVLNWIDDPKEEFSHVYYIIWKDPWMVVSKNTFIGSVLSLLGYGSCFPEFDKKYAEIELLECLDKRSLFLFSSEPYDFNNPKEIEIIKGFNVPSAIVNGESFSWFGERSLKFLENL